jgi:hypothetical protein
MSIANLSPAQMIFLGILVLTTMVLLMRTSRYFTRPRSPEPSWSSIARKPKGDGPRNANIPQEMASWEVEMHEFVREIKAELDSKMRALQAVTADADRAAARLEAALRGTPDAAYRPKPDLLPKEKQAVPLFDPPRPAVSKQGIDLSNLPTSQAESLSPAGVPCAEHSSAQAKKEEIYTLADYGMKPAEIASRVGHPIGEVELILSLRGKK